MYHNNSLFKTNVNLKDNLQNFPIIFFLNWELSFLVVIVSEKNPYNVKLNYSFLIRVSSERYTNIFMFRRLPISQKA